MHAAVLDVDGNSYAFTARSGTGKSTHIRLWKKLLGDDISVVNGDKPIIKYENGEFFAYGTPWAGKEGWQTNSKTNLKKICFLERGMENKVVTENKKNSLSALLSQIYIPKNNNLYLLNILDITDKLIENTEFYRLRCNMDISAAETAFKGIMI